jgi:hypothetical protein
VKLLFGAFTVATPQTALTRLTGPWAEVRPPAGTIVVRDIATATAARTYALAGSGGSGGVADSRR